MKVDNVLILAAGKGTRMGEIGKVIPKVLWPIFNRSILELEVEYAKSFNPKKIFINVFNYKDKVLEHIKSKKVFSDVEVLVENEILDVGGAVHNLAKKVDYRGNLLVLNSDQFIILDSKTKEQFYQRSLDSRATLLVYKIDPKDGYSSLEIKDGYVSSIINKEKTSKLTNPITYTGMSLINLDKLERVDGKSSFFQTVAKLESKDVNFVHIEDSPYWDFGTINRYIKSINELKISKGKFKDFLIQNQVKISDEESQIQVFEDKLLFKN